MMTPPEARRRLNLVDSVMVAPPDPQRSWGLELVGILACALILFVFIGWATGLADDVADTRKRVELLELTCGAAP